MVITGGPFVKGGPSIKTEKRKFKELTVSAVSVYPPTNRPKISRPPLAFYDEDLIEGKPNKDIPLLIRAKMANIDVRRVLVDQGSSVDIMYKGLFDILKLPKDALIPYEGMDLQGFNGAKT